jgi:hypothetical protein
MAEKEHSSATNVTYIAIHISCGVAAALTWEAVWGLVSHAFAP